MRASILPSGAVRDKLRVCEEGPTRMAHDDLELGHDSSFAVRWKGFRAFRDTGWVTLKPATLLLGLRGLRAQPRYVS